MNFHPHIHTLLMDGIMKDGIFYEQINISTTVVAEIFRARLIRMIFEVDTLRCQKCGGEMRIIAFITDQSETKRILKHIGEETARTSTSQTADHATRPHRYWVLRLHSPCGSLLPGYEICQLI